MSGSIQVYRRGGQRSVSFSRVGSRTSQRPRSYSLRGHQPTSMGANSKRALSKFLLARGASLMLLELTFLRLSWTFNFDYKHYILAGAIWMIGWSMIILATVIRLPTRIVGIFGIAVVALHNV